jgi:hypothetical protein
MSEEKKSVSTAFLVDERVTIKYINRSGNGVKDTAHVAYGGLFRTAEISIPAPVLDNQKMKNLLTKEEKDGLEHILKGLNLSIYGDFWKKEAFEKGILPIYLGKDETVLDKSDPYDYIKYKVLMASPIVAKSLNEVRNKATYRFVMTSEGEELSREKSKVGYKVMAYEAYVAHKNNKAVLRYILRNLGKYTSTNQKLDFLQIETSKLIEKNPSLFVSVAADKQIKVKVLIEECVEVGIVKRKDEKYYDLDGNPLSEGNTPTIDVAADYLSSNLGQEMRLALEAKLKNSKD